MHRLVAACMLLCRSAVGVRTGPLIRTTSQLFVAGRGGRPRAVATEAALPVFDERLVSDNPELVKASLQKRKMGDDLLQAVDRISLLTAERSKLAEEGNNARNVRKTLSAKIGGLMKAGEQEEAEKLKEEVARANELADASETKVEEIEAERSTLFNTLPNLLDPRTPEGANEDSNVEVSTWGCDGELATGRLWHDDVGASLGGLDMERAAKLSGARRAAGSTKKLVGAAGARMAGRHALGGA